MNSILFSFSFSFRTREFNATVKVPCPTCREHIGPLQKLFVDEEPCSPGGVYDQMRMDCKVAQASVALMQDKYQEMQDKYKDRKALHEKLLDKYQKLSDEYDELERKDTKTLNEKDKSIDGMRIQIARKTTEIEEQKKEIDRLKAMVVEKKDRERRELKEKMQKENAVISDYFSPVRTQATKRPALAARPRTQANQMDVPAETAELKAKLAKTEKELHKTRLEKLVMRKSLAAELSDELESKKLAEMKKTNDDKPLNQRPIRECRKRIKTYKE